MPTTPTREHAAGMLAGLAAGHVCGTACTSRVTIGKNLAPKVIELVCPYTRLNVDDPTDRRIIQSIYAIETRAAMGAI